MRTDIPQSANHPIAIAPTQSLTFQLVRSQIELAWRLVKLGHGLQVKNKNREAAEVLDKARNALEKGEEYSRDLTGAESVAAASMLQILREVIGNE